jgi:hypothetical protein
MATTTEKPVAKVMDRAARIASSREKLTRLIEAGHPNSNAYKARLAEYDKSEKVLKLKAEIASLTGKQA